MPVRISVAERVDAAQRGAYRTDDGKVVWVVIGGTRDPLSLQDRCRLGGKED